MNPRWFLELLPSNISQRRKESHRRTRLATRARKKRFRTLLPLSLIQNIASIPKERVKATSTFPHSEIKQITTEKVSLSQDLASREKNNLLSTTLAGKPSFRRLVMKILRILDPKNPGKLEMFFGYPHRRRKSEL